MVGGYPTCINESIGFHNRLINVYNHRLSQAMTIYVLRWASASQLLVMACYTFCHLAHLK